MEELVEHAAGQVTDGLPPVVEARLQDLAGYFDAAVEGLAPVPLTCVIFHLTLPPDARRIDYVDIQADQGKTDYIGVLQHAFAMARAFNPDCRILYITGEADDADFVPADVTVVRLPLEPRHLMYERVVAISAYVQSKAFASNTVFLDSDAFVNRPLAPLFRLPFDVAVTYRNDPGLMKINEGVLFASPRPGLAARGFFRRYLATYEALRVDPVVVGQYKEIRRWRGGQLSLSAVAHVAGVVSETDSRNVAGALVRYLPCNSCNFFVRDGDKWPHVILRRKYVLHLKGPTKLSTGVVAEFQRGWHRDMTEAAAAEPAAGVGDAPRRQPTPALGAGYIKPGFSLINKEYNKPPFSDPQARESFMTGLQSAFQVMGVNQPDSGAFAADDMIIWFRNLGFLEQDDFISAFGNYRNDGLLRARIWRIYMLCWAVKSCAGLPGDFMDIGCYDGRTVEIMERYCNFSAIPDKTWWLYDMFENPPKEARKVSHGPQLFDTVRRNFESRGRFRVIKGPVPDSFAQGLPERVAFAQIDLNAAEPEIATLDVIYDRVVPGGLIIFDDYGFRRHRPSFVAELDYFTQRGQIVWESPTGQGLLIKR